MRTTVVTTVAKSRIEDCKYYLFLAAACVGLLGAGAADAVTLGRRHYFVRLWCWLGDCS